MLPLTKEDIHFNIEQQWRSRAASQYLKPKSAAYKKAEVEFFCGAMAALQACYPDNDNPERLTSMVPPKWVVCIMSGRPVVEDEA